MMPEMDGIEMIKELKSNFDTSHIPVILLTAKSSVESKIEGLTYGADAYLTKPFNSTHLKAQIANLIEQRNQLIQRYSSQVKFSLNQTEDLLVTDKDAEFLEKVFETINNNIGQPELKVEKIARAIGLSRTSFFNKLKSLTGLSPIDLVKEVRLNKSLELLETGNYTISEVSYMCGFNDPGYYSKCFKDKFKTLPSTYSKERE